MMSTGSKNNSVALPLPRRRIVKWFACDKCDFRSKWQGGLKNHYRQVHDKAGVMHNCSLCDFESKSSDTMHQHMHRVHNARPFVCEIPACGRRFATPYELKRHRKDGHDKNRRHVCHVCKNRFRTRHELLTHVSQFHERHVRQSCDDCQHRTESTTTATKEPDREEVAANADGAIKKDSGPASICVDNAVGMVTARNKTTDMLNKLLPAIHKVMSAGNGLSIVQALPFSVIPVENERLFVLKQMIESAVILLSEQTDDTKQK